jgi:hypothetical protein
MIRRDEITRLYVIVSPQRAAISGEAGHAAKQDVVSGLNVVVETQLACARGRSEAKKRLMPFWQDCVASGDFDQHPSSMPPLKGKLRRIAQPVNETLNRRVAHCGDSRAYGMNI